MIEAQKVEKIIDRIKHELGAEYIGKREIPPLGSIRDAACFCFKLPGGSQFEFKVCGKDCLTRDERALEDFIRARIKAEMRALASA